MKANIKRASMAILCLPVLYSCATYNSTMNKYYTKVQAHDYDRAVQKLHNNKFIQRNRNQLLYYEESGRMYRLLKDYTTSNQYLNQADEFIENTRKSVGDIAVGNLLNPMQQTYRGEDYEKFMVHFYKAMNYLALGQKDEAVVEARRITLSNDAQFDKFKNTDKRYSGDAFAMNVQGMLYEAAGDVNNAFIAYRNAANLYEKFGNTYYGVEMPLQLKYDLIRTAHTMGFTGDAEMYERQFNINTQETNPENGELILFLEEGIAPVKEETNLFLTSSNKGLGNFYYTDPYGVQSDIYFDYAAYNISGERLSTIRTLRVAMPQYRLVNLQPYNITITDSSRSYSPQLAQNINALATLILRERFLTELTNAMARQLTKKLVEKGTQAAAEGISKGTQKKPDNNASDEEKKKAQQKRDDNAKMAGEVAGLLINLVNTASEKADTRNWQSLPAFISYVRIPLKPGEQKISISYNGKVKTITVTGGKTVQIMSEMLD